MDGLVRIRILVKYNLNFQRTLILDRFFLFSSVSVFGFTDIEKVNHLSRIQIRFGFLDRLCWFCLDRIG